MISLVILRITWQSWRTVREDPSHHHRGRGRRVPIGDQFERNWGEQNQEQAESSTEDN